MSQNPADLLRIAFAVTELEVGGAERNLVALATGIDRRRFDPVVYSLAPRPPASRDELVRRLDSHGVPVHFLDAISARQFFATIRRLRQCLARQSPHLLQTFLFHANVAGAWAARRAPRPVVVGGMRVAEPNRWRMRFEHALTGNVARFVCVSEAVADHFHARAGFERHRLVVIPNGINCDCFPATHPADLGRFGIAPTRPVLVYVGRLDRQKGVDWLLRICPTLFAELPDHDLLVVGDGPLRGELESLADSLGISTRVHFAGRQDNVAQILAASALLLLPSRWEGMPNVLLEAMASGIPVVASRVEGVEELLGPAAADQTANADDGEQFAARVLNIVRNPSAANRLGHENRQRAADRFPLSQMIRRYEELYLQLLSR